MTNERFAAGAGRKLGIVALYVIVVGAGLPFIWSALCGPMFFSYDTHLMEYVFDVLFRGWFICVWGSMLVTGLGYFLFSESRRLPGRRAVRVLVVAMLAAMLSVVAFWSLPFALVEIMRQAHAIGDGFKRAFSILWMASPIDRAPITLFKHLGWFAALWAAWSWTLLRRNRKVPLDPLGAARPLLAGSVATLVLALLAHGAVIKGDRAQLMFVDWYTAFYVVIAVGVLLLCLVAIREKTLRPAPRRDALPRPAPRGAFGNLAENPLNQR